MDDSEDINRFLGDSKYRPVVPIKDMPIPRSQYFVFRNGRAPFEMLFQSGDLMLNVGDESSRFAGTILADIVPNFLQIPLGGSGDLNLVSNGHA
jgi:hypothetical protein